MAFPDPDRPGACAKIAAYRNKDTALISLVGLVELMRAATLGAAATREPLTLYLAAAVLYFIIGACSQGLFSLAERRFGRGMRGRA
ncbi:MAG: hypothetical protein L0H54_07280 [Alcaligenaceae bacterium]|nr:hypothetical protein [Alcaligenaceae bacterium]